MQLPNARNIPTQTKPENIVIAVDKDENVYWNNAPVDASELKDAICGALRAALAKGGRLPEVHIRGDRSAVSRRSASVDPRSAAGGYPESRRSSPSRTTMTSWKCDRMDSKGNSPWQ